MTSEEWQTCGDPDVMLGTLVEPSDRKFWLLAAACCRRVWDWMGPGCCRAVEVLEARADGEGTEDDLIQAAAEASQEWLEELGTHHPSNAAYCATGYCNAGPGPGPALESARAAAVEVALALGAKARIDRAVSLGYPRPALPHAGAEHDAAACRQAADQAQAAEQVAQADLVRDIFNPWEPTLPRSVRTWNGGTVVKLAGSIYDDKRFEDVGVLADALEEAHVRGAGCSGQSSVSQKPAPRLPVPHHGLRTPQLPDDLPHTLAEIPSHPRWRPASRPAPGRPGCRGRAGRAAVATAAPAGRVTRGDTALATSSPSASASGSSVWR